MSSGKPIKKAEREDPVIKETVRTRYIPYIDNLVVEKFKKRYIDPNSAEEDWRKGYHTSDNIDRFLIAFTEKFIEDICSKKTFFKKPEILKPMIRNIAEYLSVYFVRTGQFATRGDAKNYFKEAVIKDSRFIRNLLDKKPAEIKSTFSEKTKAKKFRAGGKSFDNVISEDIQDVFREMQRKINTGSKKRHCIGG